LNFKKILCILPSSYESTKPQQINTQILMKTHQTFVKVRYAETDQMGVVHHGNYAEYLEMARIDWLAQFDVSYRKWKRTGSCCRYILWSSLF
jgi:hypothetical protein